jgi:hypothetical protein
MIDRANTTEMRLSMCQERTEDVCSTWCGSRNAFAGDMLLFCLAQGNVSLLASNRVGLVSGGLIG